MCIKFRQIWNVIIRPFFKLIFFLCYSDTKMVTLDQAPKTFFFPPASWTFCLETFNEKDKKKKIPSVCLFGNSGFLKIRDRTQ